jgi:co-chaperonin GroES (HSP10)
MSKWTGYCIGSNVVVEPIENKQISEGGLDFTETIDKNQRYGKGIVVSIGEDAPLDKNGDPYVKEGDTILYDKNKSSKYTEGTIEYVALYYRDIFKVC